MCFGRNTENAILYFINKTYASSGEEEILGTEIDGKLSFLSNIKEL